MTLAQGEREESWPRLRGCDKHGICISDSLEALIRTGSFKRFHLYYTAHQSGVRLRKGNKHNPDSLLEYNFLPHLVDALLLSDFPEMSFHASSRLFVFRTARS